MEKKSKVEVSICCLAYNHELYIKETLDSILAQKVNFKYEIIIHDDASTDGTLKILREYKSKFPNLIKIITEKENQYSKDPQKVLDILFKKAKGKYIAFCECDDYWAAKNKLQKQYNYMEKNPACSLCVHAYKILKDDQIIGINYPYKKSCDVYINDFFERNTMIQSATMFFKTADVFTLPNYFYSATIGDIPIQLHLIQKGYCHYINDVMSVYRFQSLGSFSQKNKGNRKRQLSNHLMTCRIYENFDKETELKYHDVIQQYLLKYSFNFFLSIDKLDELKKEKYKELYKEINFKKKLKLYLKNNSLICNIYAFIKKLLGR